MSDEAAAEKTSSPKKDAAESTKEGESWNGKTLSEWTAAEVLDWLASQPPSVLKKSHKTLLISKFEQIMMNHHTSM
jgi:hypothetical protein